MSFYKRSTIERVLARHHFKRSPASAINPSPSTPNTNEVNPNPPDVAITPAISSAVASTAIPPAQPTTSKPPIKALPPVGTNRVAPQTTPLSTPTNEAASESASSTSQSSSVPSSSSSSVPVVLPSSSSLSSYPVAADRGTPSSTPSGSASAASTAPPSPRGSQGVPPGAVGAIVAVAIIILVGLAAFLVRRRYLRRRAMKRNTWGAGLVPSLEHRRDTVYAGQPFSGQSLPDRGGFPPHGRLPNAPMSSEMAQGSFANGPTGLPPPVSTYNPNSPPPPTPFVTPSLRAPSLRSMAPSVVPMPMSTNTAVDLAIVARTFIPSLPDELHIANGEQIRVLTAYDDGWALCSNVRGEQGVVPLECLERIAGGPVEMNLQPQSEFGYDSNRTSRRLSSLAPKVTGSY